MNKEASSLLAKLVTEIYKNEQLQQKVKHLEANWDEAIEYLRYALDEEKETPSKHNDWRLDLLEILERGKEDV